MHFNERGGYWLCKEGGEPRILQLRIDQIGPYKSIKVENMYDEDIDWEWPSEHDKRYGLEVIEPVDRDGRPLSFTDQNKAEKEIRQLKKNAFYMRAYIDDLADKLEQATGEYVSLRAPGHFDEIVKRDVLIKVRDRKVKTLSNLAHKLKISFDENAGPFAIEQAIQHEFKKLKNDAGAVEQIAEAFRVGIGVGGSQDNIKTVCVRRINRLHSIIDTIIEACEPRKGESVDETVLRTLCELREKLEQAEQAKKRSDCSPPGHRGDEPAAGVVGKVRDRVSLMVDDDKQHWCALFKPMEAKRLGGLMRERAAEIVAARSSAADETNEHEDSVGSVGVAKEQGRSNSDTCLREQLEAAKNVAREVQQTWEKIVICVQLECLHSHERIRETWRGSDSLTDVQPSPVRVCLDCGLAEENWRPGEYYLLAAQFYNVPVLPYEEVRWMMVGRPISTEEARDIRNGVNTLEKVLQARHISI
jgi:hypothetical protein